MRFASLRTWISAILVALSNLACSTPQTPQALNNRPAFLDSPTEIRVGLEPALPEGELTGAFKVLINGEEVAIASVKPAGEPERERLLPRTPGRVVLPGTIQSALGGKEWDPDGDVTQMTEVSPGVHELVVVLPKGSYEFKVARNGAWNENYGANFVAGGQNISLTVPAANTVVKFVVDFNKKLILNSIQHPDRIKAPAKAPEREKPAGPVLYPAAVITLAEPLDLGLVDDKLEISQNGHKRLIVAREILSLPEFRYAGELGPIYTPEETTFKVWSPVASQATLLIFQYAVGEKPERIPMVKDANGVWSTTLKGDLNRTYYEYEFESYGQTRRAHDIYSRAASPDSRHSMVVNLDQTNPPNWPSQPKVKHQAQTDAIIYEMHVRDFTVHPDSGVDPDKRGTYAGLVQRGTRVPGTQLKTGLDYLVDLGVTDVHLLPVHNFLSAPGEYTWGYATNHFNVPEETYSQRPTHPVEVIREFKVMVRDMHQAGLRVVLDVVYNHTWPPEGEESSFWQTVPYYYFRTNDRGDVLNESGVGNALADERPMVRKFVRDSLLYWIEEYNVDGFRFDLLGMHTPESVKDWAQAMRAARPDILLYGEPWTGGGPTRFPQGAQRGTTVAVFNDRFRGAFRGELDGPGAGFALGGQVDRGMLQKAIAGWIDPDGFTDSPEETVNYVSAHDNLTLWDRIDLSLPNNPELHEAAVRLSGAAVLLSQGVPFLEGGAEIGRTKGGNHNSYNSGDKVNGFDWTRSAQHRGLSEYFKGLIKLRKEHPVFRLRTADQIRRTLKFLPEEDPSVLAYTLDGEGIGAPFRQYLVVLHGGTGTKRVNLPEGRWTVLANEKESGRPLGHAQGSIVAAPLSAYVFVR